jgi:hypothetical protein
MATIKIGNIELRDWTYNTNLMSYFRNSNSISDDYGMVSILKDSEHKYLVRFSDYLEFLGDIFDETAFQGPIDSIDDAKKQVDDFLIRMSKLTAFT